MESPTYSRRRKRATRRIAAAALADWLGRRVVLLACYRDFDAAERDGQTIRNAGTEASVVLDVFGVGGPACLFVLYAPNGAEAKRAARILRAASRPAVTVWREARRLRRAEVTRPDRDRLARRGPDAPPAEAPAAPRTPRSMPPAQTTREALRRLLHAYGKAYERATGADWETERPARIARVGYAGVSSTRLDRDVLSVLVDDLRADLEAAGVDMAAMDAAYQARQTDAGLEASRVRVAA